MIANNLIQAEIISKLKADTALIDFLTDLSAGNEIREAQWQGAIFTYPAVRVDLGTQIRTGNGACRLRNSEVSFSIISLSESDSSQQSDVLADLADEALFGTRLSGTGWASMIIDNDGLISASRTAERVWFATGLYSMRIYDTT